MKLVIIESPFAGDWETNLEYLRAAMADCLKRGEAPYASHALYTQPGVLDDNIPEERKLGIEAGFAWARALDEHGQLIKRVVYGNLGISAGMKEGIAKARALGQEVEYRMLKDW